MVEYAKRKAKELECFDYKNKKQKRDNASYSVVKKHDIIEKFKAIPMTQLVTPEQKIRAVKECFENS